MTGITKWSLVQTSLPHFSWFNQPVGWTSLDVIGPSPLMWLMELTVSAPQSSHTPFFLHVGPGA